MHFKDNHTPPVKRNKKMSTSTDDEPHSQKKSPLPLKNTLMKYKTQMCRNYSEVGYCPYYNKCQFAHGLQELHQIEPTKNQFYRTKPCKPFKEKGICSYGFRCQFSHTIAERAQDKVSLTLIREIIIGKRDGRSRLMRIMQRNQEF